MTEMTHDDIEQRNRQSRSVAVAVARLVDKLGYDPEIVFEGAMRGAIAALMAQGVSLADIGNLLKNASRLVGTLDQDN